MQSNMSAAAFMRGLCVGGQGKNFRLLRRRGGLADERQVWQQLQPLDMQRVDFPDELRVSGCFANSHICVWQEL